MDTLYRFVICWLLLYKREYVAMWWHSRRRWQRRRRKRRENRIDWYMNTVTILPHTRTHTNTRRHTCSRYECSIKFNVICVSSWWSQKCCWFFKLQFERLCCRQLFFTRSHIHGCELLLHTHKQIHTNIHCSTIHMWILSWLFLKRSIFMTDHKSKIVR